MASKVCARSKAKNTGNVKTKAMNNKILKIQKNDNVGKENTNRNFKLRTTKATLKMKTNYAIVRKRVSRRIHKQRNCILYIVKVVPSRRKAYSNRSKKLKSDNMNSQDLVSVSNCISPIKKELEKNNETRSNVEELQGTETSIVCSEASVKSEFAVESADLQQHIKSEFGCEHSSLENSSSLDLGASHENRVGRALICEVEDAGSSMKCVRSEMVAKATVKLEPWAEDVAQKESENKGISSQIESDMDLEIGTTSKKSKKSRASRNCKRSNRRVIRETRKSTSPTINTGVELQNESFRRQEELNLEANRTVFESNNANEELEMKLFIEENLNSDLGNMVFQRFCCLNRPDGDKSGLEIWNKLVKMELQRLSQVVSFKKLSCYMKSSLLERLSRNNSLCDNRKS